jgi:alpha-L-rhamnosidase
MNKARQNTGGKMPPSPARWKRASTVEAAILAAGDGSFQLPGCNLFRRVLSCLTAVVILLSAALQAQDISPVRLEALRCEQLENPIGIGVRQPRLSWKLRSNRTGEKQTAYQIRAASSRANLGAGQFDLWDSGKVSSDQSVLVDWSGKSLGSRSAVVWQVRVWDMAGQPTAWSDPASFELGLLNPAAEWRALWITADLPRYDIGETFLANASWISAGSAAGQSSAVRRIVNLPADAVVRSAIIDAAADGLVMICVNGWPTLPGRSSRTAPLHADVRARLVPGSNSIAIGSAAVRTAVRRDRNDPGRNAIAARGLIELENGRRIEFNTGGDWKAATAPTGEWASTNYDDGNWPAATVIAPYAAAPSRYSDNTIGPGRYLRKQFTVKGAVARARLYATALGVYEASLNGRRIGDARLDPGWTDYKKRVMVQTFDVTSLISPGTNALGALLGDGWYAGRVGWMGLAQYGARPVFSAQLEIAYADGSTETLATDASWKAGAGEIVGSDAQWGEIIDARRAIGWDRAGFDDSSWTNAVVEEHTVALDPQRGPPVRTLLELAPQKITRRGEAWIVDLGQNLVGHVRLSASGAAGTVITLRHAEILDADGSIYTENLRPALSTDTFILAGKGRETFEPHFTFHGFRYVEITGYPGTLTADDLRGMVVGSDTPPSGTWESSHPGLNRLFSNILWSQRGNFLSVPTDCPQRDERMGWMGDAQVFAPTAVRNADVAGFFNKWMVDVNDAQTERGDFANYSPRVGTPQAGWPVWGDAGVIVPWVLFQAYGDKAFLADNYAPMTNWLEYCSRSANNFILTGGVGDHLAPQRTPTEVVDTAYFANSARIVSRAAALLGRTEDAARYDKLFRDIAGAFQSTFLLTNGLVRGDTQTAAILALRFELLPESLRGPVAQRLAENVEKNGHLTTGFVGVGLICPALTQIGRSDLAWRLVLNDTYPSWLFSVKNGATTIWERWDGWTSERGFQDSSMNSFNHYSLGAIGEWLYSGAAGIEPDPVHPGYKHFFLRPQLSTRLSYVKATQDSPYGKISSHWRAEGDRMIYEVTIPPNATAELTLPVPPEKVLQAGKPLANAKGSVTRQALAAGTYQFSFPK